MLSTYKYTYVCKYIDIHICVYIHIHISLSLYIYIYACYVMYKLMIVLNLATIKPT